MRPPAGKRPTLKSRCCPGAGGAPEARLVRRLRHAVGATQLREVLLGLADPDPAWRDFCRELLERQYLSLGDKLVAKLADAYRELGYPSPAANRRDALLTQGEAAAGRRQSLTDVLSGWVAEGQIEAREATRLRQQHEWQQVALAAVGYLLRTRDAAGLATVEEWLLQASDRVATALAGQLGRTATGLPVLRRAVGQASPLRLAVLLGAVGSAARRSLRAAARRRVLVLSEVPAEVGQDLVAAARLCLPEKQLTNWYVRWLGLYGPEDELTRAVLAGLREVPVGSRLVLTTYIGAALELERGLARRDERPSPQPELAEAVASGVARRQLREAPERHWALHQVAHLLVSLAADDTAARAKLLGPLDAAPATEAAYLASQLLPVLGERLEAVLAQAGGLLPREVALLLWVEGLRAQDPAVREVCIAHLGSCRDGALPYLLQALPRDPLLATAALHVLQQFPVLTPESLAAVRAAWGQAAGEAKAGLTILLCEHLRSAFRAELRPLLCAPEAVLRAAGVFGAHSIEAPELLPALFRLMLDPHAKVAALARQCLILWPTPAQVAPLLAWALRSRSGALRHRALYILAEGGHRSLLPQARQLVAEGKLPAEAVEDAEQRLRAGPSAWQFEPHRFVYSDFRLPQHLPRWREYWPGVRRHEELVRAFHRADLQGLLSDDEYLEVRAVAVAGQRWGLALGEDLVDDALAGAREDFSTYHGWPVPPETWRAALRQALRVVDKRYLREDWERGLPELAVNEPTVPQWVMALWWEIETALLALRPAAVPDVEPPGFPGPEWGGSLAREWAWLARFSHWHWGFTVRPRVPVADLVAFVHRHWRSVSAGAPSFPAQVAREILDYCALWGQAFPGPKRWRQELRHALWECHAPLRRALLKRERGDRRRLAADSPTASAEEELDHLFTQILADWNPFHGSPAPPPVPLGLLGARVGTRPLPRSVYGRGVPFTHYLKHRLDGFYGPDQGFALPVGTADRMPGRDAAEGDEDRDDLGSGAPRGTTSAAAPASGWERYLMIDEAGRRWLRLHGLAEKCGLPYRQLLRERDAGFLKLHTCHRRLVVPYDDDLDDLCAELQHRALLRRVSLLARELGLPPSQLRRARQQLPAAASAVETLTWLRQQSR